VIRSRLVLAATFIGLVLLAFAASAGARPHKSSVLTAAVTKRPSLTVGKTAKVKVVVEAQGGSAIKSVVLRAKPSKGLKVKPAKVKLGTFAPGKKRGVSFEVTATSAANPKLRLILKAPGQPAVHASVRLKIAGGDKVGGNDQKEEAKKAPDIVGRYFWNTYQVLTTTYMHAYYFVDEHWVYRGVPKEGLPACGSQTANGEEDGCLPYTWNESTGALSIGGTAGEYKTGSHGLEVGEESFSEAVPPEAGTKFDAAGSYINEFGICPSSCSFVTVDLEMSSSGEFARASGVSGFFGEGGSYGALPPEDHGTYSIDPRGRITFTYADGHVITETIAVMLNEANAPDPNFGLLLGESAYFGPDSGV
jgi:hypothetical protein